MKRLLTWRLLIGMFLLFLSVVFYGMHYFLFQDAHHIFIFLIGDVAFVFIEVLLVTMIIHHLLNEWDKRSKLQKLNMVIETFFSEFGKLLLAYLSSADTMLSSVRNALVMDCNEQKPDFKAARNAVAGYCGNIDMKQVDLGRLDMFLRARRGFLVSLLQNPTLLEHESFTESLMAVFHVTEELAARDLTDLSPADRDHTKKDLERAYGRTVQQWVAYMEYIHKHYPYFFLFAMRTNPFDADATGFERWSGKVHGEIPSQTDKGMATDRG